MRYSRLIVFAIALVLLVPSIVTAHDGPKPIRWTGSMNQTEFWEARFPGFTCDMWDGSPLLALPAQHQKVKVIVKGGKWVNIYHTFAHPRHVHGYLNKEAHDFDVSWKITCLGPIPVRKYPATKVSIIGPKGDPWYRFTFQNTGEFYARCWATFEGRNGTKTIGKFGMEPGWGYKTGWQWVKGDSRIKAVCWSNGTRTTYKVKRAAPPGSYGPLWYGYRTGFFFHGR